MKKIKLLLTFLNLWRVLPVYLFFLTNRFKDKCKMDFEQWVLYASPDIVNRKKIFQFAYLLLYEKTCRNILLNRLNRNPIMYVVTRMFFKPLESCYIGVPPEKIGGGFSFQHGFSTIIAASQIGSNCRIYQQVTIGYKGAECPIIGDNVTIAAGAIVIGGIKIEDNSRVGAGAVVTHDVLPLTIVAGVPARVIKNIQE